MGQYLSYLYRPKKPYDSVRREICLIFCLNVSILMQFIRLITRLSDTS